MVMFHSYVTVYQRVLFMILWLVGGLEYVFKKKKTSYWECHHPESQLTKSNDVHSHDPIGSLNQAHYSLLKLRNWS